ncbi:MAG: asparaginase [Alphaproteobacteria bacterium]|nr:asparaginase [Alphaproteobacteria bacterium]
MAPRRSRLTIIGTGGSIASPGTGPLNLFDYGGLGGGPVGIDRLLAMFPGLLDGFEVTAVEFRTLPSPSITPGDWLDLARRITELARGDPPPDGIVVTHGTASIEETAYFLHLALRIATPLVVVGAQRPPNGISSDGPLNLLNAARVATAPAARGLGVLVVMNDEIHSAREVTKTANFRLHTFRTPDFGTLGAVDPDGSIALYRRPLRRHAPDTEFDVAMCRELPLVDIAYSYAGADGRVIRHLAETGSRGIVSAGQSPGWPAAGERAAMIEAIGRGVIIIQSSRAGSGRVLHRRQDLTDGLVAADNLNPQKARVLAMLALTVTTEIAGLRRIFAEY